MKRKKRILMEDGKTQVVDADESRVKRPLAPTNIEISNWKPANERKDLVARFAPECLSKRDEKGNLVEGDFHEFFGASDVSIKDYEAQGYKQVLREDGKPVYHKRQPLLKIPTPVYRQRIEEAAHRAVYETQAVSKPNNPDYADGSLEQID